MIGMQPPPDLDANGNPVVNSVPPDIPPDIPASNPSPSGMQQMIMDETNPEPSLWDRISSPLTTLPSRIGDSIANYIDKPSLPMDNFADDSLMGGYEDFANQFNATVKGGIAGGIQGVGNILSQMTSPIDLGAAIASGGSSLAGRAGFSGAAKGLRAISGAMSAPVAAHGAQTIYEADDLGEAGQGLMELAGGAAGMTQLMPGTDLSTPTAKPTSKPKMKANTDGTFTDLLTGEVFDNTGKPLGTVTPDAATNQAALTQPTQELIIKPSPNAINEIKQAVEGGYKHGGLDENGNVKMVYTGKPTPVGPLETEVMNKRGGRSSNKKPAEQSITQEVVNFPRAVMASTDFSAPLRQGLPLIHKKAFWTSLDDMFRAWGSENAYKDIQAEIASRPLFKTRTGPDDKILPSFAEEAGLKLSNLDEGITAREEALQSTWAEMIPGIRRSNRAYTAFLNKLRADTFQQLVNDAKIFAPGSETNVDLAKGLANFVNTASGRGSLGQLESSAKFLNATLFAPRLIASRLQMLNPHYYWAADPIVRKEAMKSLLAVAGSGMALGQLAKMAGAEVETTPTSADFGKIKIGNIRLDPFAGFQQYAVLAARMIKGEVESTTTGNTYTLGEKFGRPTRLDIAGRFIEGKANPIISFVTGLMRGKDFVGKPFDVPEELASRLTPIYLQDLKEILTNNPNLVPFYHDEGLMPEGLHPENLPYAIPPAFGMGMQNYGTMK